jgi:hypothetical protein
MSEGLATGESALIGEWGILSFGAGIDYVGPDRFVECCGGGRARSRLGSIPTVQADRGDGVVGEIEFPSPRLSSIAAELN